MHLLWIWVNNDQACSDAIIFGINRDPLDVHQGGGNKKTQEATGHSEICTFNLDIGIAYVMLCMEII